MARAAVNVMARRSTSWQIELVIDHGAVRVHVKCELVMGASSNSWRAGRVHGKV